MATSAPQPTPLQFPTTFAAADPSLTADLNAATTYLAFIQASAAQFGLQPCVIGGIGSRESRWGLALTPVGAAGTGDHTPRQPRPPLRPGGLPPDGGGFGRGLMQIDFDAFPFAQTGNWRDPQANIQFGCRVLSQNINFFRNNMQLQGIPLLRAAVAAYNRGAGNIRKDLQAGLDVDANTAHHNYSADVLNRAGFFQLHGWK